MKDLLQVISKYYTRRKEPETTPLDTGFVDLAPIDDADLKGGYQAALSYALTSPRILNIALSGPYGSGKSSIIATFEKNSDYKFLKISLAAFPEDVESQDAHNESLVINPNANFKIPDIERSILQQMLYGADANKLPFSRFKRIATPQFGKTKSFVLIAWAVVAIHILMNWDKWVVFDISLPFDWVKFLLSSIAILGLTVVFSEAYKMSFGYSLKKISLKNAEIETEQYSDKSILNRHLDEIIYFFQETEYDAVVIEDLDRFGDPEIFVKLREINSLINNNAKTSGKTKFIYALKDDIFLNKNRAKFFDFIIPVIPIINASNSLDKMQERLRKHEFEDKIEPRFLREVSLYLDDLRLIQNIVNEFIIYYERLKSDKLDATKLLAMMIYKNLYPSDFEKLHHGEGTFHSICQKKPEYLQNVKSHFRSQISELKNQIEDSDSEMFRNISDLIRAYLGQIITHVGNAPVIGLVVGEEHIPFSDIVDFEKFEGLISDTNITFATNLQSNPGYRIKSGIPFSQIEKELNEEEGFLVRKENIENKTLKIRSKIEKEIQDIEAKTLQANRLRFSELIDSAQVNIRGIIDSHHMNDGNLLIYLVKNGYLDDNYYLYISNFHEGRLTVSDRDFLLTIRNFEEPDVSQPIDTPKEVCANMRQEDFENKYVLNINLMDFLIEGRDLLKIEKRSALRYISENFDQSEEFLAAYYNQGKERSIFIRELCELWPSFGEIAIGSSNHLNHLINILKFADNDTLVKKMNSTRSISRYLGEYGHLVFERNLELIGDYEVLKQLSVEFDDLSLLQENPELHRFAIDNCLYVINPGNVVHVLEHLKKDEKIEYESPNSANYSMIMETGDSALKKYVDEHISTYVNDVLFELPENVDEGADAILALITNPSLDEEKQKRILSEQVHVFDKLHGIPESFWSHVIEHRKIVLSWYNLSEYRASSEFDETVLTAVLNEEALSNVLLTESMSASELGEENCLALSLFIMNNNDIDDEEYCSLVNNTPYRYHNFPIDITVQKQKCIVENGKILLNESTLEFCDANVELKAGLIESNIETYLEKKGEFAIDDDVRKQLLQTDLSVPKKVAILLDLTPAFVENDEELSSSIARILNSDGIVLSDVDNTVLSSAIINARSKTESVELLTKSIAQLGEVKTMEVIARLPSPLRNIANYGRRPKIAQTPENLALLEELKRRRFISSFGKSWTSYRVNTKSKKPS